MSEQIMELQQDLARVTGERDKAVENMNSYQGLLDYAQATLKQERAQLTQAQEREEMYKTQAEIYAARAKHAEESERALREALKLCVEAWEHEGEPGAIGYELAIEKAQAALQSGAGGSDVPKV